MATRPTRHESRARLLHTPPVIQAAAYNILMGLVDLPTEILTDILLYVARDDNDSAYSVIKANDQIKRICRVCRRLRAVCRGYGPAWCNIPLSFSQWGPPVGVPTLSELRARLARSGDGPLRICFNLPVSANSSSVNEGTALWSELLLHKHRWAVFHLKGPARCDAYVACAKSLAFDASFGQSTPKLNAVTLLTNDDTPGPTCPIVHRGQAAIRVRAVTQITATVPISLRPAPTTPLNDYPSIAHLTYLEIGFQRDLVCTTLLVLSPNLRTLVWRNNEVAPHFPSIEKPSLVQLILFHVALPPPIRARNLSHFVVKDQIIPLDHATFLRLSGGHTSHLSRLSLGDHKVIRNEDLVAILEDCSDVTEFAFPSGQARTECFRLLSTRVVASYIFDSTPRLRTIRFPGRPSREPAVVHHDFLVTLGVLQSDFELRPHQRIFRVRCGPCMGPFSYRNKDFVARFKRENRFCDRFVCVAIYEKFYGPVAEELPETFDIIVVFSDVGAAQKSVAEGVVFRGRRCSHVEPFLK
ncbi:hypothetical protein C8R47DRAFT_1324785 [Mycena vitilis]|nr:hypothetical protein C8R47DRAFT_1324785 [Mycena vitilis]